MYQRITTFIRLSLFTLLLASNLNAQSKLELGLGVGRSETTFSKFSLSNMYSDFGMYNVGIYGNYYFNSNGAPFNVTTGLRINDYFKGNDNIGVLKIPIGLEFCFGTEAHFMIGGGLENSLLVYLQTDKEDFITTKKSYFIGWYFEPSLGIPLQKNDLELVFRFRLDGSISKIYDGKHIGHGGEYYNPMMLNDSFIHVGIRKTF